MKTFESWFRSKPVDSQQAYLDRLGKMLIARLPLPQVQDILTDYQEQFTIGMERGKSEEALLAAQGPPEEAAAQLLDENPSYGLLRHRLLWGALLALSLLFVRYFVIFSPTRITAYLGGALSVPLLSGTLFALLRGGARGELERQFPPRQSPRNAGLFGLPLALSVTLEAALQLMIANANAVADALASTGLYPGIVVQLCCFGLAGLGLLLASWWTVRSVTVSVRYFPGVVHALGMALASVTSLLPFISMNVHEKQLPLWAEALLAMLPYLVGLLGALVLRRWLEDQFPECFRQRSGGRQDYLDQLGKCLLRWFPAGQVREILADYREQFELGLERGKSETALAEELGSPETVARDLLAAESPLLRRVARQRTLLWCIPLIPAVYGLVGMFCMYEFGWQWAFLPEGASVFLVLGAVAAFALLHGGERAEVEACFPPERGRHPLWVHLAPLAVAVLTAVGFWYLMDSGVPKREYRLYDLGPILGSYLELAALLLALLLVWTLSWSFSRSIWYFPVFVQSAGVIVSLLEVACLLHGLDLSSNEYLSSIVMTRIMLLAFAPYLTALVLAGVFWLVIGACAKRGKEG